jgi:hypothetical protein
LVSTSRLRQSALEIVAVAFVVMVLILGALNAGGATGGRLLSEKLREDPEERSGEYEPAGESEGGDPLTAALEEYQQRAYPATDIPFSATTAARQAYLQVKNRGLSKSKKLPGQWTLVGPSTANYPAILTFSGAPYVTSGRITALAIAPSCSVTKCRLWLAAAGGGIWRTDNALSAAPAWKFVSGSFASNAIGSIVLDLNDPTGNTIYAGTGEANASADSEAGVGIYKSTDGGDTWALLGSSGSIGYGRAIASIAIDPANSSVS